LSAVSVNVSPGGVSLQRSLVGVATDRGAGVLVLLPAFMARQQVVQPVNGALSAASTLPASSSR
jgi:hypothetical protein